ncbi:ABC transporter permease [Eubacteriales bacterium KG127]
MNNNKVIRLLGGEGFNKATSSIVAILIGLVFGFIILLIANPDRAVEGFMTILGGGFLGGGQGFGQVLYYATPLIMTGLSVGCAFKTGLFNIGASGQFIVGGAVAIYIGVYWTNLGNMHWIVAIICAAIVGGVWGALPGLLKAFFNVHEVIATIMMNYIGMNLANYLIRNYAYDSNRNLSMNVADSAVIPKWGLDNLFFTQVGNYKDTSSLNGGFIIAIVIAIIIYILFYKTTFGYELMAVGNNRFASKYAGINSKRQIVMSMVIAGALAGIGGALVYLSGPGGRHITVVDELASDGFNGISVALLGLSSPIGIIFSSVFIGYLNQGGTYLQSLNYMPEIIQIIIACIIYFSAFSLLFRRFVPAILKKVTGRKEITPLEIEAKVENMNDSSDGSEVGNLEIPIPREEGGEL